MRGTSCVLILGVESSCDETAAAVVEETGAPDKPWRVRSNVIASQVALHREWGGVVPELASRQHLRDICGVLERALADAGVGWRDLGAVAVTQGPGLVGSLLVGLQAAKSVALSLDLPLVAVHHLAGHIESLILHNGPLPLPAVVLVVSGGHTSLYLMPADGEYHLIGRTRDDAAGEAYDKVAKLLGLGLPGRAGDRPRVQGRQRSRLRPAALQDHAQGPHAGAGRRPPAGLREGARAPRRLQLQRPQDGRAAAGAGARRPAVQRAGDGRPLRVVPARRRRRAADADVRGGGVVRGEEHRHRRRRLGQQPAPRRRRRPRRAGRASRCSCRRCR